MPREHITFTVIIRLTLIPSTICNMSTTPVILIVFLKSGVIIEAGCEQYWLHKNPSFTSKNCLFTINGRLHLLTNEHRVNVASKSLMLLRN